MTEVLWDVALGIAITTVTGRLMLGDGEGGPSFLQTMAAVSAGAMPGIVDYTNGAAFRFPRPESTSTSRRPARIG